MRRSSPKSKTLYEIAAERQSSLQNGQPFSHFASQSNIPPANTNDDGSFSKTVDPFAGTLIDTVFTTFTLTMLHFTLDVLVHHQYLQSISWATIVTHTLTAFPALLLLVHLLHSRSDHPIVQLFFFTVATAAGCYLVHVTNVDAVYAVMKRAPPVGTLWIWAVLELGLGLAVASVVCVAAFFWRGGYTIF